MGNRLSQTANGVTTTYTYDSNDRLKTEVTGGNTIAYEYDNNGNLIERKENGFVTATYVWDDQNRMVQATTSAGTVTYAYDDENIRVSETKNGVTTSYLLDKNRPYAQVLAKYENGNLEASYTYGLDLIEQERNGNESYYQVDGLGSTRGLTNESGNVTDSYIYDAYGNLIGSVGSTENDYRFAGEQWDGTLGQYYLRQRYYDPQNGRFTRRDTYEGGLGEPVSLHKYLYANGNPVNAIDPSGLFALVMMDAFALIAIIAIIATAYYLTSFPNSEESGEGFSSLQDIRDFLDSLVNFSKDGESSDSDSDKRERKKPKSGSGKEKATDAPSWLKKKGETPFVGESGKEFAKRVMDEKYGEGNYDTGPKSEFNKIKKYGDRSFK